jgi:hypothetical protein
MQKGTFSANLLYRSNLMLSKVYPSTAESTSLNLSGMNILMIFCSLSNFSLIHPVPSLTMRAISVCSWFTIFNVLLIFVSQGVLNNSTVLTLHTNH